MSNKDLINKKELEYQYSPSLWSKRFEPNEVVNKHIEIVKKASLDAKTKIQNECIQYGVTERECFEIFGGDSVSTDAPIFVYIHGGYWQELDKSISSYPVNPLSSQGIRVIIVGYNLAPQVKIENIIEEIKKAATKILLIAESYGSRNVWFSGHSAGAHLASVLLTSDWISSLSQNHQEIIKGFVLISGIYNLIPIVHTYINDALKMSENDAETCSPMISLHTCKKMDNKIFTTMIFVGEYESPEFHKQSEEFAQELKIKSNCEVEFAIIPAVDHFNIVENLAQEEYVITRKIISAVKNNGLMHY